MKCNSTLQHKKETHDTDVKSKTESLKNKKELEASIAKKEQEKQAATKKYQDSKAQSDQSTQELEQLQRRVHGFSVAKSDDGSGRVKTFSDELMGELESKKTEKEK